MNRNTTKEAIKRFELAVGMSFLALLTAAMVVTGLATPIILWVEWHPAAGIIVGVLLAYASVREWAFDSA